MLWRSAARSKLGPNRRAWLGGALAALALAPAQASEGNDLSFDDLYEGSGALGLVFGPKLLALKGRSARMRGYMAPPLKPESAFFVLTREPVSVCPFCSSDADWPTDIVVIYLRSAARPIRFSDPIDVVGRLEVGSVLDPETGFLSQIRLADAVFRRL